METSPLLSFLPDALARSLRETFDAMDIAEEEIRRVRRRHRRQSTYLNHAGFLLCMPTASLQGAQGWMFRAHCREVLERLARGDDTRRPTAAEGAQVCSLLSLEGKLRPEGAALYAEYFLEAAALVNPLIDGDFVAELQALRHRGERGEVAARRRGFEEKLFEPERVPKPPPSELPS